MNPVKKAQPVHIVGSGLAGSEAAHFLAEKGIQVHLHEMRPKKLTPAHTGGECAELVCSNSLKSKNPLSAPGMLKAEMRKAGSLILTAAEKSEVPAGEALGVDRDLFSKYITERLKSHPNITFYGEEVTAPLKGEITLLATGPLTSDGLATWLARATGTEDLYFYDAIAPIVDTGSINMEKAFVANRYDKGEEEAYLNCPMDEQEYAANFTQSAREAMNLAIEIGYLCSETTEILVQKAFREAKAVGVEAGILTEETRDEILARSEQQALAVKKEANL